MKGEARSRRFSKLLIANRGEIACRIARTAKAMGYRTVAVFSDADRDSLHVKSADEAVHIGASEPAASYLNIGNILEAARKTGADAVHPGYGFLAENADFAEACLAAGSIFVGPPPDVIRKMGDKASAKALMQEAGIPCVPGYFGEDQSWSRLQREASQLGYPLLIKAVAGGGGRGIRVAFDASHLQAQTDAVRREAKSAFGDDRLMLEKLIEHPRHIEVQVFGDCQGNIVHLFERDCTAQRRRQKLIEEAPSPVLSAALREKITSYAVQVAKAVAYENGGTVEFIADDGLNFYFLEMNTRLQVEHPVTEMLTGLDLVEWQLRIAAGESLPLSQSEISMQGHAIEMRLCAEDPSSGFLPQTGRVEYWRPKPSKYVRIDHGIGEGAEIGPFYDSMLGKIIAQGSDREEAIRRLTDALAENPLLGFPTNQRFTAGVLSSDDFRNASLSTGSIDRWIEEQSPRLQDPIPGDGIWAIAAELLAARGGAGDWFRPAQPLDFSMILQCGAERKTVGYSRERERGAWITIGKSQHFVSATCLRNSAYAVVLDGIQQHIVAVFRGATLYLAMAGVSFAFDEVEAGAGREKLASGLIEAPVSGVLAKVFVDLGDAVAEGQTLAVIEAMKMETRVLASIAGKLTFSAAKEGSQVGARTALFEIAPADGPSA